MLPTIKFNHPFLRLCCLIFISILLLACAPQKPKTPMAVAQAFWTAALAGDVNTARQYLTPDSQANFKIILQSKKDYVELGEQSLSANQAQILTTLIQHQSDQNPPHRTALRTILVNHQGQWLVDYNQTRDSMLGTELQSTLDQFSRTIRETIEKGMQVMGESMKEELQKMEQSMNEFNEKLNEEINQELEKQKQRKQEMKQKQDKNSEPETTTL